MNLLKKNTKGKNYKDVKMKKRSLKQRRLSFSATNLNILFK